MIALATMPESERRRREIERLRNDARTHPGDPELQLHLAGLLLADGQTEAAAAAYRELLDRNADATVWQRAGRTLANAGEHDLARAFLERAAASMPTANLDLAMVLLLSGASSDALKAIDNVPEAGRQGDYLLVKARILDAAGRGAESEQTLEEALRRTFTRADVAQQAAVLLAGKNRLPAALQVLRQAAEADRDDPELLLRHAVVLALMDRGREAEEVIGKVATRWPEWDRAHLVHGLLLERDKRPAEARRKFQTAAALGSIEGARCALERLDARSGQASDCACGSLQSFLADSCL